MEEIKPDTIVVVAGKLATVHDSARRGGADGYQISDGGYTRFVSAWQVEPARIGDNVCAGGKVCPPAWCCPLPHLDAATLERVRAQS